MKTKQIIINDQDYFFDQPITVQIWENDVLMHCNHAGAEEEVEELNDHSETILACDKCPAYQITRDRFGYWYDEDEIIERVSEDVA